jgi:hypothetical protein
MEYYMSLTPVQPYYQCMCLPMTKIVLLISFSLLLAHSAQAQTKHVFISGASDSEFKKDVLNGLKARIGGTSRFDIVDSAVKAELYVEINCLDGEKVVRSPGGICAYSITYYPDEMNGLSMPVYGPGMVSSPDSTYVSEAMFQKFMEQSTEKNLAETRKLLKALVTIYNSKIERPK